MLVNNKLDAHVVHSQRAAKRAGLAHKHGAALTQGAIDRFDDAGLPAAFGVRPVGGLG